MKTSHGLVSIEPKSLEKLPKPISKYKSTRINLRLKANLEKAGVVVEQEIAKAFRNNDHQMLESIVKLLPFLMPKYGVVIPPTEDDQSINETLQKELPSEPEDLNSIIRELTGEKK